MSEIACKPGIASFDPCGKSKICILHETSRKTCSLRSRNRSNDCVQFVYCFMHSGHPRLYFQVNASKTVFLRISWIGPCLHFHYFLHKIDQPGKPLVKMILIFSSNLAFFDSDVTFTHYFTHKWWKIAIWHPSNRRNFQNRFDLSAISRNSWHEESRHSTAWWSDVQKHWRNTLQNILLTFKLYCEILCF